MVTKRLSLTETFVLNLLTARDKSFLHTSKQFNKRLKCYDVTVTKISNMNEDRPKNTNNFKRKNV